MDLRRPAWVERTPACVGGQPATRLIFIFRAIGCAWSRRPGGGCSMCGFRSMTSHGTPVSAADLIAQFESVFGDPASLEGVGEVDLFNSGSFLSDEEMPREARIHVLRRLGRSPVRRILIESRPEYVSKERIAEARSSLGDKELDVGIGLESADDRVREALIRKGFGRPEYERAVQVLADLSARLLAYVSVKPPGLSEREAVEDAVASARYVFGVAARIGLPARVALQPLFVAPGSSLEKEFLAGRYRPPSLWTAIEAVRLAHPLGEVTVGLSDEGLRPHTAPEGCERCTPSLRAALAAYNRTLDLGAFEGLDCACRWRADLPEPR